MPVIGLTKWIQSWRRKIHIRRVLNVLLKNTNNIKKVFFMDIQMGCFLIGIERDAGY